MGGLFNSALGYMSPITGAMGLDPVPPDYSGMMFRNMKQRQNMLNTGMNQINAVYGGGTVPLYSQATSYDPSQTYYRNAGTKGFVPYMPSYNPKDNAFGGKTARNAAIDVATGLPGFGSGLRSAGAFSMFGFGDPSETPTQFRNRHIKEAIRNGQLYTQSQQTYQGFGPDFYNQRAQDYVNYAMPQLAQQARETANSLTYNLSNRGLMDSTIAKKQASDFNRNLATQEQGVADSARGQAMDLQKQVEGSRQAAITQLYNTQDPNQSAQSALQSYFNLSQPSVFAPLGNAFSNIVNQYYANSVLDQYRNPTYSTNSPYATPSVSAGALPNTTYGSSGGGY